MTTLQCPAFGAKMLYKYMKAEHAAWLVNFGRIRIGTLFDFRKQEHGSAIGDPNEGTRYATYTAQEHITSIEQLPGFVHQHMGFGSGENLTISADPGFKLRVLQSSPDLHLFCCTSVFSHAAMAQFGYNTCVAIDNPDMFLSKVTYCLRRRATFLGYFPCKYDDRDVPYDANDALHPALIKEPIYDYQSEVRAIWQPRTLPIGYLDIECPSIRAYCRIHHPTTT